MPSSSPRTKSPQTARLHQCNVCGDQVAQHTTHNDQLSVKQVQRPVHENGSLTTRSGTPPDRRVHGNGSLTTRTTGGTPVRLPQTPPQAGNATRKWRGLERDMRSLVDGMMFAMEGQISAAEDDDCIDAEQDQELTTLRRQLNLALRENLALKQQQQPVKQAQEDPHTLRDGPDLEQKVRSLEKQLETATEENVVLIGQRRQVNTESLKSEPLSG